MGQSVRQQARAKAQEAAVARRREREAAERRRTALGVDAAVALAERDAAVERFDRAAAAALRDLVEGEGVPVGEVGDWVPDVPATEVRRLLRLAADEKVASATASQGDRAVG